MAYANEVTTTDHKVTAEEVEKNCPTDLQNLATEIKALIERMDKQVEHVKDQSITVDQLLVRAKKRCDKGGFKAFHEKFFPDLGKSRFYELLQIATDKRSLKEVRAITRERVAKHRANKANSVTVTENSSSMPQPEVAPTETGSIVPKQAPDPARSRSTVNAKDESLREFNSLMARLLQKIGNGKPERFEETDIPADELAKAGKFLIEVADRKSHASKPTDDFVPPGNGTVSPEQSAEDMKAELAALAEAAA